MKNNLLVSRAILAACHLALVATASAEDWPQWGGNDPGRNMHARSAKGIPASFDPGKFKQGTEEVDLATAKNVKWVAKLGSQSYGNPSVAGGRVFVGTNNDSPRDPQHKGDRSVLMTFDEKSGDFLWQLVVPKLASGKVNDWESLGILSSPTVEGDRLFLVTSRCEVVCLDVNGLSNGNDGDFKDEAQYIAGPGKPKVTVGSKDADIIWRYDMMDELGVFPHNASNCSVLLLDGKVYACTSNGQDWTHVNIPSPNSPSFIALDKATGKFAGEDDAQIGPRIFHGQWTSPSTGIVNGQKQVFFGGGDGLCYAFDPTPVKDGDTSFLKKIWWADCNPPEYRVKDGKPIKYPHASGPSEINATPVFWKGRVYIAIGQDPEHGEGIGNLVCLDPTQKGDITKTGIVWQYKGIHRSISTVAISDDGLLFIADFSGFVHCLDAATGKLHWVHDLKSHVWGSPLLADGKVYVGAEDGSFLVFAASKEKKVLAQIEMPAPIYSTPVVANNVLYVATTTHLYAVAQK